MGTLIAVRTWAYPAIDAHFSDPRAALLKLFRVSDGIEVLDTAAHGN